MRSCRPGSDLVSLAGEARRRVVRLAAAVVVVVVVVVAVRGND